jgi:hypothetical protein
MIIFSLFDFLQYKTLKVFRYYYQWLNYVFKYKKEIWTETHNFNTFIFWEE